MNMKLVGTDLVKNNDKIVLHHQLYGKFHDRQSLIGKKC